MAYDRDDPFHDFPLQARITFSESSIVQEQYFFSEPPRGEAVVWFCTILLQ